MHKQNLAEFLTQTAVLHGDFTLTSGAKSKVYLDIKKAALTSEGAYLIGMSMLSKFADLDLRYSAIGGLELGAVPVVSATLACARVRGTIIDGFVVRKGDRSHGTGKKIEGVDINGLRVAVLEDVTTSGGSALEAVQEIRKAGGDVAGVFTVVDRLMGAREFLHDHSIRFHALTDIKDLGL